MTQSNQRDRGFVSILVTMILMVVTSLIVLSFAFLARQNQTRNLNQQLSTQAFYAAESGINDAVVQIKANPAFNNTDCGQTTKIGAQTIGDASLNVSYTCVLVNQSPTDLKYDNISTDSSTVVHIHVNNPGILQISWQDASKPPTASSFVTDLAGRPFNLPQTSVTGGQLFNLVNNAGILRTTVIPTANAQQLDGDSLLNNSRNFFLYPYGTTAPNSAGSANMSAADGSFVDGHCSASTTAYQFACNVQIGLVGNDFYVRLKSIYRASAVDIKVLGNDQVPQAITGAQAVIDATGKAQNVLRRVQVRLPLTAAYYYPEFGLESGDTICKRFSVWQTGASVLTPTDTNEQNLYNTNTNPNNAKLDEQACAIPGLPVPNFP